MYNRVGWFSENFFFRIYVSLMQTKIFLCFEFYTDSKKCKNELYKQVKQEKQAQSYPPNM